MELRQLKYFVRAAELLNFTQAANELYITQSTLSQQIRTLEDALSTPLFDRIGKRVRLTEAGKTFLDHARKTLHQADQGQQIIQDLLDGRTGELTIGATYGLTAVLVRSIAAFSKNYPGIRIRIVFGSTDDLLHRLDNDSIDAMLSFLPPGSSPVIESKTLFTAHLSLVLHRTHPRSGQKKITLRQLTSLPLALPAKSYSIRNYFDEILAQSGIGFDCRLEVNDINTLLQLADTGEWCTVLMNTSLFNFPSLKAIPVDGPDMRRQATISFPAGAYRKKSLTAFHKLLTDFCAAPHALS